MSVKMIQDFGERMGAQTKIDEMLNKELEDTKNS